MFYLWEHIPLQPHREVHISLFRQYEQGGLHLPVWHRQVDSYLQFFRDKIGLVIHSGLGTQ